MELKLVAPNGKEYRPFESQQRFHTDPRKFKCFAGGMGSGKTVACITTGIALSIKYPNNFGVVVRDTVPSLKQTTMRQFLDWMPKPLIEDFNKQDRVLKLINGSEILFTSADNPEKFRSMEIGWFYINEANGVSKDVYDELVRRLRNPKIPSDGYLAMCDTNPTSKNHWVYKLFTSDPNNYCLIKNSTRENRANLPEHYIPMLENSMSAEVARRYIDGEFSFEPLGEAVYRDFEPRFHVGKFNYNENLPLLRGWDFGFHHPAVVFFQRDNDGRVYVLHEMLGKDILIQDFADSVKAKTFQLFPGCTDFIDFCDPAGGQVTDKGDKDGNMQTSIILLSKALGHQPQYRRSKIMEGVNMIRDLLKRQVNRKFMFQVDESCDIIIEGLLGGYHYDEKRPDVICKDGYYDHLMDAMRYGVLGSSGVVDSEIANYYNNDYVPNNYITGY